MRKGIILAPTMELAKEFQSQLGLRYWWPTSPRVLASGGNHGLQAEPRLFLVEHPGHDPGFIYYERVKELLAPCFSPLDPVVYSVRLLQPCKKFHDVVPIADWF